MISLYFHTIRFLKFKQIYYRLLYYFTKPNINHHVSLNLRSTKNLFLLPVKKKSSLSKNNIFTFFNISKSLSKIGWNGHKDCVSYLWRYNQHYFDDLNSTKSFEHRILHNQLLEIWIDENKIGEGVGWEPYPTSLRIINWIKWSYAGNRLSKSCRKSLFLQARWLNKRIEWHILGNHLFVNAKALVFSGFFFSSVESDIWLKKGLKIINHELKEQVLDDGGNFERSPMYHAIFLEDVLDLINISKVYPKIIKELEVNEWKKISVEMLNWLATMTHPDGSISFFNDAALEIAPNLNDLKKYASRLGVNSSCQKFNKITHLKDSGYIRLTSKDAVLMFDVAPVGPDYIPGHAHADTLSFELSLFGQRIIVNGGVSEYSTGSVREYERSTKAHNTVEINNQNSSEVWGSFRVARRAYPFDLKINEFENIPDITCSHDGYKRLSGKPIHKRHIKFYKTSIIINDYIEGSFENAYAYFHFHPSIKIFKKSGREWKIEMFNGREVVFNVKKGVSLIETSYYSPKFGKRIKIKCLKVALDKKNGSCIQVIW